MAKIFHSLTSVEEALELVSEAVSLGSFAKEEVDVMNCVGRVLYEDLLSSIDSPPFDRSEVDGYAVSASDVFGAEEDRPVVLRLVGSSEVGRLPQLEIHSGECVRIATGAPIPKGADAVVMVEYTKEFEGKVEVYRAVVYGENIAQAGSDYVIGDLFLRRGTKITSREVASLSALGFKKIPVFKKLRVGLFSSGVEIMSPGSQLTAGKIYDANGPAISAMIEEAGCVPFYLGVLPDSYEAMYNAVHKALQEFDVVITSGSTSAGLGDMMYKVFNSLGKPGILVHGLKVKPGKPTVVAAVDKKILFGLPGFPVSAMMIFTVLVKPILAKMSGTDSRVGRTITARVPFRIPVGRGRRTLIPVSVVCDNTSYVAYPTPGSSGSVSVLNYSDGFVDVPEDVEFIDEDEHITVNLFSDQLIIPELTIIGSHCPAIELIFDLFPNRCVTKVINVGSLAGWNAIKRKEADIAGTHLLDERTLKYNTPFLEQFGLERMAVVVKGYTRKQGIITKPNNPKNIHAIKDFLREDVRIVNRNKGSGTRTFLDYNLKVLSEDLKVDMVSLCRKIKGYNYEAKTHSAVAVAVAQGRADAGIGLEFYARKYGLNFIPLVDEEYDFVILKERLGKARVSEFLNVLGSRDFARILPSRLEGYSTTKGSGKLIE